MDFQTGDQVMHSTYGLGHVMAIEERTINNNTALYYMIQVADLTIWVPIDENSKKRLRFPTSKLQFRKHLSILSSPAEQLPEDRRDRNIRLHEMLNDGEVASICKVIRDLTAFRRSHPWNDYDNAIMKRATKALIGEWSVSQSLSPLDAEKELSKVLAKLEN